MNCIGIESETLEIITNRDPVGVELLMNARRNLPTDIAKSNGDGTGYWFDTTPPPIEQCKCSLADARWDKQNLGVVVDGIEIQTDENSVKKMESYVTESIINGLIDVPWKLADGTFKLYTVQELKPVYKCVVTYINECFRNEMSLQSELDLAVDPAAVNLDTGWPSRTFTTV